MSEHLPTEPLRTPNAQPGLITELPNWTTYEVASKAPGLNFHGRADNIIAQVDHQTPEATYESLRHFADNVEATASSGLLVSKRGEVYTASDIRASFHELTEWSNKPSEARETGENPLVRFTSNDGLRGSIQSLLENKSVANLFLSALEEKWFDQMKEEGRVKTEMGRRAVERMIINP